MTAVAPRVVLVGPSGAGKSTVGPLVAAALSARTGGAWTCVDVDAEIERRAGRRIAEIFARQGEAAFRKLERAVTEGLAQRTEIVVATGGGWVELGAAAEAVRAGAMTIYLQVSPEVAAGRVAVQDEVRPLLAGGDATAKFRELLARRERFYVQANHTVSVDSLAVDEVAATIVALALGGRRD